MAPSRLDARPIGPQHPRIRELLALRKDASAGRILVEGCWEHNQLLDTPTTIDTFLYCPEAGDARTADAAARVAARGTEVYRISEKLLARLSRRGRPDGLISIARLPAWQPGDFRFDESSLVLVADGVEYAGNLGTLIRTVDACRADCLVLTSRRARLTHPTVYAASRGMVLTTPVLEFDAIPDAAAWLRGHEFDVHLADPGATGSYRATAYRGRPTAFVVGSEGSGLDNRWHQQGFRAVSIPMLGQADSLNVALSAGILLFEARAHKEGW
ncbi:TrmH family RNA methyltransferase [Kribbella orskensis]|uniref:TrmH family RNA methyltransferase n=1 Tax=Kribbella orskensis TaxID=2512216 RepID=A0ABY2B738_9ACTN|nr:MULTISPECIES: TrmH family RNA methyltransferase [Kribbella]TCN28846.1 TrmH family RNA methyltransferase [Kribbella sp. VKM Ac-2500]TCO08675.1 TrmH family RNA methyltransferase [Kribbella orskensis]